MKRFARLFLMVSIFAGLAVQAARENGISIHLVGEDLIVLGKTSKKGSDFVVENIQIQKDDKVYSLATGQAWASRPLDQLCDSLTNGKNPYSYLGDNVANVSGAPNDDILVLVPDQFKGGDLKQIVSGTRRDTQSYLKNLICTGHLQEFYQ